MITCPTKSRAFRYDIVDSPGPLTDQFSILKLVTERLDAAGIAYMLTGSIAAGYYARPHTTRDIELVLGLRPHNDRLAAICGLELTVPAD